jgi:hypothetical protein
LEGENKYIFRAIFFRIHNLAVNIGRNWVFGGGKKSFEYRTVEYPPFKISWQRGGMKVKLKYDDRLKNRVRWARLLGAAAAAGGLIMLAGCVNTPHTTIQGNLNSGQFLVKAPKDGDLQGLDITRDTNGTFRVHIDRHTVRMNPDVVSQTAAGQAQIIQSTANGSAAVAGQVAAAVVNAVVHGTVPVEIK